MSVLTKLRNAIAEKVVSTEYLLGERAKWEEQLRAAQDGEFEDNDKAMEDALEELEDINAELARRGVVR